MSSKSSPTNHGFIGLELLILPSSRFQRHMDTLFLITHTSTFNITLQALTLIHHVISSVVTSSQSEPSSSSSQALAARYYRTLYATLLDPRLYTSAKQAMYLNLTFKSLKSDLDTERVKAFVKRLCQVLAGGFGGTEFVAGGLWLLGEVSHRGWMTRVYDSGTQYDFCVCSYSTVFQD